MSRDRKLKLVYDVNSIPSGIDIATIVKIMESHDTIFWDSKKDGARPRMYGLDREGQEEDLVIVDIAGNDVNLDEFKEKWEEEEKWAKELHRCQNSPIYYFTNYGTTVYPHSQTQLQEYLASLELEDLSGITDSDKAEERWKAQKQKMQEAMKDITIEHLKERKGIVEGMKVAYETKMNELITVLKDKVKLHDKEGKLLPEQKQVQNLIGRIKQFPIPSEYGNYRSKKSKWDHGMLLATPYVNLLNLFNQLTLVEA